MNLKKWRNFVIDEEESQPEYVPSLSLLNESTFDSLDLTNLSESQIKLLREARLENVLEKYSDSGIESEVWEELINFDGEYNFKHLDWMAKMLASGEDPVDEDENDFAVLPEPWEIVTNAVSEFVRFKDLMRKKDLNQYASITELLDAIQADVYQRRIDKARKTRGKSPIDKAMIEQNAASIIYEDNRYFVVRPNTTDASCYFGKKTRWCIAQQGNSYFAQYTEGSGKVFYYIKDDQAKPDDKNAKMALEVTQDGENTEYNAIWDRYDDPIHIESSDVWEVASALMAEPFNMKSTPAEQIAQAIESHILDNPAASPFADLEKRINQNNEFDGGFLTLQADVQHDEYSYMYISADVRIPYVIKSQKLIEMLENDEIDVSAAEAAIVEALEEDGSLYMQLAEDVDIGASKYWWPNSDWGRDPIEVDIREADAPGAKGWTIMITITGWTDQDTGGTYYKDGIDEAESFANYMQEEWGERNTLEIEEVFDRHIYKYFVEFASIQADAFRNLKADFQAGTHTTENENVYYTIDDEDDENSDLNLFMEFTHELTTDALRSLFSAREMVNAIGNTVYVAKRNIKAAENNLNMALRSQGAALPGFLEKAIYNIYQQGVEFSNRQLKLDFGPDWDASSSEETMPEVPQSINVSVKFDDATYRIWNRGDSRIVPDQGFMKITFSVYIPFHKSEAELKAFMSFFKFILKNYDAVSGYIHKYVGHYSTLYSAVTGDDLPVDVQILKENLLMNIFESQMFLKNLNKELKDYRKHKKSKLFSKS